MGRLGPRPAAAAARLAAPAVGIGIPGVPRVGRPHRGACPGPAAGALPGLRGIAGPGGLGVIAVGTAAALSAARSGAAVAAAGAIEIGRGTRRTTGVRTVATGLPDVLQERLKRLQAEA